MNLDDRLRSSSAAIRADGDDFELRRQQRDLEQTYQRMVDTPALKRLDDELELFGALERAYEAAEVAEAQGDLVDAATYFRVAADQGVGDAALRVAVVLMRLGEYDEAAQWCAVADMEGFAQAAELQAECRQRIHVALPLQHSPQRTVIESTSPRLPANVGHEVSCGIEAQEIDEAAKRRRFLAQAAAVTCGMAVLGSDDSWLLASDQPWRLRWIDHDDVWRIEAATRAFRVLDHRYGGIACRAAILHQLTVVEPVLQARCTDLVRERLQEAIADLHNLAGWMSFDSGLVDAARTHFARALVLAKHSRNESLVANILSRAGRMYLHHDEPEDALKLFQLGQLAAMNSGSRLDVARLAYQEAWAYGLLGCEEQAMKMLARARHEIGRAELIPEPSWAQFFNEIDLQSMIGAVHGSFAQKADLTCTRPVITTLTAVVRSYSEDRVRGRTIALTTLARSHLVNGDAVAAAQIGDQALDTATKLRSARANDHLRLLMSEADQHRCPEVQGLVRRIVERFKRAS